MSTTRPVVDQSIWDYAARPAASYMSSPISPSYHHLHPHTLNFTTPLTAAQSSFITMSPLTLNASPALAFPEKFRALGKLPNMSIEACILQTPPLTGGDPLASPNPSFDWADDVEQEFYSGDDSDSDSDDGAGSPKVDRPFPSGLRSVRESGFSLAAILEEDEDEEDLEDDVPDDEDNAEERSGETTFSYVLLLIQGFLVLIVYPAAMSLTPRPLGTTMMETRMTTTMSKTSPLQAGSLARWLLLGAPRSGRLCRLLAVLKR